MPATPSNMSAEPVTPIPPLTDQDRAAAFPQDLHGHAVHDGAVNYFVLFDQLEWQFDNASGANWDTKAWVGGDLNRIWIHSEGASADSRLEEAEVHVTYGRSFARWWDVVAGVRHDVRPGPGQTWGTVGIQGLAPQFFDIQATLYVGESATTLARFEAEYELLLTNRLVLQPLVELNIYGKDIADRGIGAGLSSAEGGLRLRYEFRRELAPYVGLVWHRQFGGTADFSSAAGDDIGGWRVAMGLRTWF
jgi:copper resistance protein B